jgi:methyltransferase FkbM-like protein
MQVTGSTRDLIPRYLYYFGTWEPSITRWISSTLKEGDCFIDVGANIGYHNLLASKLVGADGQVVAIEAAPWIHSSNGLGRRSRNKRGPARVSWGQRQYRQRDHDPQATIGSEVEALPMYEILRENEIERARIIKIDVEGAELSVLRGLAPILGRLRSDLEILMELSPALMPESEYALEEIFSTMQEKGFSAFVLENDYSAARYLGDARAERPVALASARVDSQADVLFSRSQY